MMHHHGHEMMRRPSSEAALRSVQKPPSKPWRAGGGLAAPTPPKVYRVEPREFRDLVQRLTGAPAAAARPQQQRAALATAQPVAVSAGGEDTVGQMYAAAPWSSFFPLMAPAAVHHPAGLDGHQLI